MTFKHLFIALFLCVSFLATLHFSTKENTASYSLLSTIKTATAGDAIVLKFLAKGTPNTTLYCSSSYGSFLLNPKINNDTLTFTIPTKIAAKAGILDWQLLSNTPKTQGQITIQPKATVHTIETYLGPTTVEAGGLDYAMLVLIPTDNLDNVLTDSTKITVKHQFLNTQKAATVYTEFGVGANNVYSYKKEGRILVSSESLGHNSKEYDISVTAAVPTNFSITANRVHDYADGNQITTFKTSVIKDRYNNTVSDGTFVNFFITNASGYKSKTFGLTLNGVAEAKIVHPDHANKWSVKAYIKSFAYSNTIVLDYKKALSDFDVVFTENNRSIAIGPLQSFMNQKAPDGLDIQLSVYKNDLLVAQLKASSFNGSAAFYLNTNRIPKGKYRIDIKAAGITKTFTEVPYE